MIIRVAHRKQIKSWAGAWAYLGNNYLTMRAFERRQLGERVSLQKRILENTESHRSEFVHWIGKQREINNDDLHWWMTHLAGRNTMRSKLFINICQISALIWWIEENKKNSVEILIICEDGFFLNAVRENVNSSVDVRIFSGWRYWVALDFIKLLSNSLYCLLNQILFVGRHWVAAVATREKEPKAPTGEVYLIHQYLDDASFFKEGKLQCRYLTVVPDWLETKGKTVFRLAWLDYVSLPLVETYRRLRSSECFIPEDWIGLLDYLQAFWNHLRSTTCLKKGISYPGVTLGSLISKERIEQLGDRGAMFWRYIPALERWGAGLSALTYIDHFENSIAEHIPIHTARTMPIRFRAIGCFPNSLAPTDWLPYHFSHGEWLSPVMPNIVISGGGLMEKWFLSQGVPPNRITQGPNLRQQLIENNIRSSPDQSILLLLSLSLQSSAELLEKISKHHAWISGNIPGNVLVKAHPMVDKSKILQMIGWDALPNSWSWFGGTVQEAIDQTYCAISMATGSAVDAVLGGSIVINVSQELDTRWNYLDQVSNEFDVLTQIQDKNIPDRLEEIFLTRKEHYQYIFKQIRKVLSEGLNPVDQNQLSVFL